MIKHTIRIVIITVFILIYIQNLALALVDEEIYSQIQFNNFITPGARALSLGGAFIGLADDATAVESNPAGIVNLATNEVLIEFQYDRYKSIYPYENDSHETEITEKEFGDSVIGIPFLSVVFPYKKFTLGKPPFIFSFYIQRLLNYKSSHKTDDEIQFPGEFPRYGALDFLWKTDASINLTLTNYGAGVAVELFDGFFFGVSPRWSVMKLKSRTAWVISDNDPDFNEWDTTRIDDGDSAFSMNTGILWRLHHRISLGVVYKLGPEFTVDLVQGVTYSYYDFTINIPDSLGVGLAFQITKYLTFTTDAVYIHYEDLLEKFAATRAYLRQHSQLPFGIEKNFSIDNIIELHIGTEYVIPISERLWAFRLGGYYEPDHSIYFDGTTGDPAIDAYEKIFFHKNDDQIHLTGGIGIVLNEHFQIDTAINIAKKQKQFNLSLKYNF